MNIKLEIVVNRITQKCMKTMEPFYYVNQQQISTLEVGTTQIIKESKPPMNTYAKYEMLLRSRMPKNKYIIVLDGTLLMEMYNNIDMLMYGS